jgi:hypothetical protein
MGIDEPKKSSPDNKSSIDEQKKMSRRTFLQVGAGALGVAGAVAGGVAGLDALVQRDVKAREKIEMEGKILQKDTVVVIGKHVMERAVEGRGWTAGPGAFMGGVLFGAPGGVAGGMMGGSADEIESQPYISVLFPDGKSKGIPVLSETFKNLNEQDRLEVEYIVDEKTKEIQQITSLKKLE